MSFVRIGLGKESGWFGAFTTRYKLVMAPGAPASFFDLERDPHEMRNALNAPEHRETIRQLARELQTYATTRRDPLFDSTAIQADLAWAISGTGAYTPAKRDGTSRDLGDEDEAGPAKGKRKAKGKAKG